MEGGIRGGAFGGPIQPAYNLCNIFTFNFSKKEKEQLNTTI